MNVVELFYVLATIVIAISAGLAILEARRTTKPLTKAAKRSAAEEFLKWVHDSSDARIKAGDPDFDDIEYRSRDASRVLLDIWFKSEQ